MSDYAIGDIQGCHTQLIQLLDLINYDEKNDRLWFVGDLVNRGPDSLAVLRFVKNLSVKPIITLGNHDLHFLARAYGVTGPHSVKTTHSINPALEQDSLDDLLNAEDCMTLSHWLKSQPLLHAEPDLNIVMVHAGIAPQWDLAQAKEAAREVESVLQSEHFIELLKAMYGNQPDLWQESLEGNDRLRVIINYFTRMRFCRADGRLDLTYKGSLKQAPSSLIPWFDLPNRKPIADDIAFGHWAALAGKINRDGIYALDTGCLWGGKLTALRLQDRQLFSVPGLNDTHYY